MTMGRSVLFSLALAALAPKVARAQQANCEVLQIHAKSTPDAIDPQLASLPALRQPPLSAYRFMKLLARPSVQAAVARPGTLALPNGRTLRLALKGVNPDGRLRIEISINRAGGTDYLQGAEVVATPDQHFFQGGQSFEGGVLVLGIRCRLR